MSLSHKPDREHPDYGVILAVVCLALAVMVARLMLTPVHFVW